jgi:glutamate formiminotransferase / 5-formyltetrahydrofolate cyclo-ligase
MLLSAPNFSEGRDPARIAALRAALADHARILDRHSDRDHHRTVFTIAGEWRPLAEALTGAAGAAIDQIDMTRHIGAHPCVGALDVCPFVYIRAEDRAAAERGARNAGGAIAELGIPVFLYGDLAATEERRERAFFRSGGLVELGMRMADAQLSPDFGPTVPHPTAGATLVTARPPLAAFNVEIDTPDPVVAQRIAADLREAGGGLPGVRAIGLPLESGRAQISTNIHDPLTVTLGDVVERVRELGAAHGTRPVEAELVGLAPAAALEGFPNDVPLRDFDPEQHLIEKRLAGGR